MAYLQISIAGTVQNFEEALEDILTVSRPTGGILVLKGEKSVVRIALDKKEAGGVAARLAPHIP